MLSYEEIIPQLNSVLRHVCTVQGIFDSKIRVDRGRHFGNYLGVLGRRGAIAVSPSR